MSSTSPFPAGSSAWDFVALKFQIRCNQIKLAVSHLRDLKLRCSKRVLAYRSPAKIALSLTARSCVISASLHARLGNM